MDDQWMMSELLANKKMIIRYYCQTYRECFGLISLVAIFSALFFFTVARFVYQYFYPMIQSSIIQKRLITLFNLSRDIGLCIILLCLIVFSGLLIKIAIIYFNFPRWLNEQLPKWNSATLTGQNCHYYGLTQNIKTFVIKKADSRLITTSSKGAQLRIGQAKGTLGITQMKLFILTDEPPTSSMTGMSFKRPKILLYVVTLTVLLSFISACIFMARTKTHQELADEFISDQKNNLKTVLPLPNKEGFTKQR